MAQWLDCIRSLPTQHRQDAAFSSAITICADLDRIDFIEEILLLENTEFRFLEPISDEDWDNALDLFKKIWNFDVTKCQFRRKHRKLEKQPSVFVPMFLLKRRRTHALKELLSRVSPEYQLKMANLVIESGWLETLATLIRIDQAQFLRPLMRSPTMSGKFLGYLLREGKHNFLTTLRREFAKAPATLYDTRFCVNLLEELQKGDTEEMDDLCDHLTRLTTCLGIRFNSKSRVQLMNAVSNPKVLQNLIDYHRVDYRVANCNGDNALMMFIRSSRPALAEALPSPTKQECNHLNVQRETPLHLMLTSKDSYSDQLREALARNITSNLFMKSSDSLLHVAVRKRDILVFKIIASRFPHLLEKENKTGQTPLSMISELELPHFLVELKLHNQENFLKLRHSRTTILASLRHDIFKEIVKSYVQFSLS